MTAASFAALLLADGRFPAGGHVHSAGVEAAITDGRVSDEATLEAFLRGRLRAGALVDAALAAATVERLGRQAATAAIDGALCNLDDEAAARVASPPLRAASRRLGRQLLRAASRCWAHPVLSRLGVALPAGAMQPVALGAVGVSAGLDTETVAQLAVHHALATPVQAAVRLLGLDPFAAAAIVARLAPDAEVVTAAAVAAASGRLDLLPARAEPLVELASVEHSEWALRMFAT